MRGRVQGSSNAPVGKSMQTGVPAAGKRTLAEQAYNSPLAVAQQQTQRAEVGKRTLTEQAYNSPLAVAQPQAQHAEQEAPHQGDTVPAPGDSTKDGQTSNKPAATYIIPFDRNPKSSPGEQIIFGAVFTDPKPNDYQLVYTGSGGEFASAGSGVKTVTFPGIVKNNLSFFIDGKWDKKTAVSVNLQLQKVSDKSVVQSETWRFTAKTAIPTTVNQREAEAERTLPGVYSYKVGPDLSKAGKDNYIGVTVLEKFEANKSNLTLADVKPDYAKANGLTSDQLVTNHFFGSDAGNNGTFTISAGDMYYDQHGGGMPDKATFEAALVAMKEIHVDLPQTYEAEPGKVLGKYTVRRILKADGSKKITKSKV